LIGQGFSFGSHSQNHTSYQDLTLSEQLAQTKNSSDFVQQQFDLSYRVFSFPFTDYQVSDQFFKSVKASRIVDLSFGTAGLKKEKYDFHFQRIPMENSHFSAAEILHHAYFYYVLKAFVAKNTIIRK
jgi:peptidoglycan/xylan/chitin deacetylase (PgdA/CDA1 family)